MTKTNKKSPNPFDDAHTIPEILGVVYLQRGAAGLRALFAFIEEQKLKTLHRQELEDAAADFAEVGMHKAAEVLSEQAEKQPPFDYRYHCHYPSDNPNAFNWLNEQKKKYGAAFDEAKVTYDSPQADYASARHKCPKGYHLHVDRDEPCPHCKRIVRRPEAW